MFKKFKRGVMVCLALLIVYISISNIYINIFAGDFFLGDGQLSGASPVLNRVYNIKSFADNERCLDVVNAKTANGSNVWTYPYNGAACQEWLITKVDGTDEYLIKDINSGKYLSIEASSGSEGANAWIWQYDGTSGQRFHIVQHTNASGNPTPYYKILTKSSGYTKALSVDTTTHNISQTDKNSTNAIMILEEASFAKGVPDGNVYFQNIYFESSGFLTCDSSLGIATVYGFDSNDHKCEFVYLGNNYYKIMLDNSNCLSVENDSSSANAAVNYAAYTGSSGQKWKVSVVGNRFKLQPQCAENTDLYLYCDFRSNNNTVNLILSNSTTNITRSQWRRYINDDFFEKFGAYLCGVQDSSHSTSHLSWIAPTMQSLYEKTNTLINYDQVHLDFAYNQSVNIDSLKRGLEGSNLFIFRGHGSYTNNASQIHLTPRNTLGNPISNDKVYSCEDMENIDISDINCALFICCESAHGCYNNHRASGNFVSKGIAGGIEYVIGFDNTLYCNYANEFLSLFIEEYSSGTGYAQAFRNVINELDIGDNQPFFSSSTYCIYYSDGAVTEYYNN